jgi:hypothetical protein
MLNNLTNLAITFAKESGSLCLATFIGVYYYRYLNGFFKLILIQTVFAVLSYFSAYAVIHYQTSNNLPANNHWLYNIYIVIEFVLLLMAGYVFFQTSNARKAILLGTTCFISIYITEITLDGFWQLANISLVTGGLILVVVYQFILVTSLRASSPSVIMVPELWACVGISLYFACNVPFIGLMPQLLKYNASLVDDLFYITEVLAILRYLFLCISFYQLKDRQVIKST